MILTTTSYVRFHLHFVYQALKKLLRKKLILYLSGNKNTKKNNAHCNFFYLLLESVVSGFQRT